MGIDRFGVLSSPVEFELPGKFCIAPVPNFTEVVARLDAASDQNNHVILPDLLDVPRRALVYQLPSTHQIEGDLVVVDSDFRSGVGLFLTGLLSILFDCRLQWEGLWHEGYVRSQNYDRVHLKQADYTPFFERSLCAWEQMDGKAREFYLQALAFHRKANGYAHGFEVFFADFTALEAVWHFGLNTGDWIPEDPDRPHHGHSKRLRKMALALGILEYDEPGCSDCKSPCDFVKCKSIHSIYSNRNDLFHEADWEERMGIMSGTLGNSAREIHLFTKRVLVASLGFRNGFTRSTWDSLTPVASSWP